MTHAAVPHSNAVFAAQPLSRAPPPEREVGRSTRPGRTAGAAMASGSSYAGSNSSSEFGPESQIEAIETQPPAPASSRDPNPHAGFRLRCLSRATPPEQEASGSEPCRSGQVAHSDMWYLARASGARPNYEQAGEPC